MLDSVDRFAVEVDELTELLLGELPLGAGGANLVSDLASAGWYPVGQRIGWHAYTLVGAAFTVCTIVGTFTMLTSGQFATLLRRKHTFE